MKIYVAAPLFNEMEIQRNLDISHLLEKNGFRTYLPQRDGGIFHELRTKGLCESQIRAEIFRSDIFALQECHVVLCLLDGRTLDEGMCVELGIGFALNKHCIGYQTDHRAQDRFGNNIMIDGALSHFFRERDELIHYLKTIHTVVIPSSTSVEGGRGNR